MDYIELVVMTDDILSDLWLFHLHWPKKRIENSLDGLNLSLTPTVTIYLDSLDTIDIIFCI